MGATDSLLVSRNLTIPSLHVGEAGHPGPWGYSSVKKRVRADYPDTAVKPEIISSMCLNGLYTSGLTPMHGYVTVCPNPLLLTREIAGSDESRKRGGAAVSDFPPPFPAPHIDRLQNNV